MSLIIPFSEACERNKDVILQTISPYLETARSVLEIGSGTGQHALHFARHHPQLNWQSSDQKQYLQGITAQLSNAEVSNALLPIELDVKQAVWSPVHQTYDVIYTANTLHIMPWTHVCALFNGLQQVAESRAVLIIYGPFKYAGKYTSASNQIFDQNLQSRGCGSAIRDFKAVHKLATEQGFTLLEDHPMPANNQTLIWQRQD